MNKFINFVLLVVLIIFFMGCTRRSGSSRPTTVTQVGNVRNTKSIMQNQQSVAGNHILSGAEIFEKYNSAVFMIFTSDGFRQCQGSGFFISSNGIAVSNYHVFKGTGIRLEIIKLTTGERYKVKEVIAKDNNHDFIIFKVDVPNMCNYIPLAQNKGKVGDKVYAIGSPRGLENTFSSGEISQYREDGYIQISVPIDHGSSGGALINEYGRVIGITSAGYDDSGANLNFAIDINVIKSYIR